VEVLGLLRIAAFLVPVSNERASFKLAVEIRSLLDDEIAIHESYNNIISKFQKKQ
jgi:hypothetical protein